MTPGPLKGLILAAGVGRRLMPLTADRPKALVEIAGTTPLERMVRQCHQVGIGPIVVVTGHHAAAIERWAAALPAELDVQLVHNPLYASQNNLRSLFAAREALDGAPFVKLDSDIVFHTDVLRRLVRGAAPSALTVDRTVALGAEEMKAQLSAAGRVVALGKWLDPQQSDGESIGIELIGAEAVAPLFETVERMLERDGRLDAYYEDAYHELVLDGWQLAGLSTDALPWLELDDAADLRRAVEVWASFDAVR